MTDEVTADTVAQNEPPRPEAGDRDGWRAAWAAQGQPWRTEPEISDERQAYLGELRAATKTSTTPPFHGVKLTRADIEWLLATHEDQGMTGPVDWSDEAQRKADRRGLLLHAADLRGADLSGLPLDRLIADSAAVAGSITAGSVPLPYRRVIDEPLDGGTALLLDGANLRGTRLVNASIKGAHMCGADLTGATLTGAFLDGADLTDATLVRADLTNAWMQQTILTRANCGQAVMAQAGLSAVQADHANFAGVTLRRANIFNAHLEGADFRGAHLEQANLNGSFLAQADLRGAYLNQSLSVARTDHLSGADLYNAQFAQTRFAGAYVEGVNFGYDAAVVPWDVLAETVGVPEETIAARRSPPRDAAETERWRAHWEAQGQPWRTEPEISDERQAYLTERRARGADMVAGRYPLVGIAPLLTRADIEWLLATHDDGRGFVGPVDWGEEAQRERVGLDVRGADLRYLDLSGLPLTRMVGGLASEENKNVLDASGKGPDALTIWKTHLEGTNLRGAHLQGAYLREARIERADLTGADLRHANLEQANLRWSILTDARLEEAVFDSAHCVLAHLERAQARGADFQRAVLRKATMTGIDLRDSSPKGADCSDALLDGANFDGANLWGIVLERVSARKARFAGMNQVANYAHCTGADLSGAQFTGSFLNGADFIDACLDDADLSGATLEDANFTGARLRRAKLDGAVFNNNIYDLQRSPRLTDADLEGASLKGAKIERADLARARLVAANLEGASLVGSNLSEVDAAGANLRAATFDAGTTLDGLRLSDGAHGTAALGDIRWGGTDVSAVQWAGVTRLGDERLLQRNAAGDEGMRDREARTADLDTVVRAYYAVSTVLRQHGLNEQAEVFAYRMRVLQQRLALRQGKAGQWFFSLGLGLLTGYGYRLSRILIAYLGIVLACAAAYFTLGFLPGAPASAHLTFPSAVLVSMTAFHGRVFSEPFAAGSPQIWVTAIEAVCGLIIEGVFVAMLTKKFFGQ